MNGEKESILVDMYQAPEALNTVFQSVSLSIAPASSPQARETHFTKASFRLLVLPLYLMGLPGEMLVFGPLGVCCPLVCLAFLLFVGTTSICGFVSVGELLLCV